MYIYAPEAPLLRNRTQYSGHNQGKHGMPLALHIYKLIMQVRVAVVGFLFAQQRHITSKAPAPSTHVRLHASHISSLQPPPSCTLQLYLAHCPTHPSPSTCANSTRLLQGRRCSYTTYALKCNLKIFKAASMANRASYHAPHNPSPSPG